MCPFLLCSQIFVEIERARLTRKLATMTEAEGKIAEAADILQEVAVVCQETVDETAATAATSAVSSSSGSMFREIGNSGACTSASNSSCICICMQPSNSVPAHVAVACCIGSSGCREP